MKIACFPNSYGRFGPQAAFDLLPDAGVFRMEMPIKNDGMPSFFMETPLLTDNSSEREVNAVRERAQLSGVTICSCNVTSGNPLDPTVLERTLRKLTIAQELGVDRVIAGGGEAGNAEEWSDLILNMRVIGDRCQELGLLYCCETHPGTCQNASSMLKFLDRVDHPQIRINFDTGNLFYYNRDVELLTELQRVLPFVENVHLKDTNGCFNDWHFPALGEGGAVDFAAVDQVLKDFHARGLCSLEIEGVAGEKELTLEATHQRIVASVRHLQRCGIAIE